MCKTKAPERNRTADLIVTNDVLYRLSYKSGKDTYNNLRV